MGVLFILLGIFGFGGIAFEERKIVPPTCSACTSNAAGEVTKAIAEVPTEP